MTASGTRRAMISGVSPPVQAKSPQCASSECHLGLVPAARTLREVSEQEGNSCTFSQISEGFTGFITIIIIFSHSVAVGMGSGAPMQCWAEPSKPACPLVPQATVDSKGTNLLWRVSAHMGWLDLLKNPAKNDKVCTPKQGHLFPLRC